LGISYLGRDELANADGELNADGLGQGKGEAEGEDVQDNEPQPASRFISKGFSRGAAPDNLVFLPSASRSFPAGPMEADVCAACGDVAVVRKGMSSDLRNLRRPGGPPRWKDRLGDISGLCPQGQE